jgi:MHS family proline/betaine transporter-like MFS transporter
LSVGGEFAGSVTYLIEMAPEDRRGFVTSWTNVGGQIGMLLGAGTPATVLFVMGSEGFHDWGWRIPFLFGGVLGAIALVLRSMLPEPDSTPTRPPGEDATPPRKELPLRRVFRVEPKVFFENMFYCMGYGVLFYITLVYLPTWLSVHTSMDLHEALFIITMVMIPQAIVVPVLALISDRQIRRTTMLVAAYFVGVVVAVPLFLWAADGDRLTVTVTATIFALLVAFPLAITPAMLAESFERGHRLTGYSVSFNTGIALGGGTAPLIATTLIHVSGDKFAPAYYLIFGCLLAAAALWVKKDRSREPLR